MTDRPAKLDWLQALRGVAAVSVLLTHCRDYFQLTGYWSQANWFFLPFAGGVDLFFVISGFIMTITTFGDFGGLSSAWRFICRRLYRIWPPYALVTIIALPVLYHLHALQRVRSLIFSLLLVPASYDGIFADQIIPQGWTLNFEFYFYCIMALSMLFGRFRWVALFIWMAFLLIVIPIAIGPHSLLQPEESFGYYDAVPYLRIATNPIIWEFVFGIMAGAAYKRFMPINLSKVLARAILAVVAVIVIAWTAMSYNYINLNMGIGFATLIIVFGATAIPARLVVPRWMVAIGDFSYTLYIQHLIVILAAMWALGKIGNHSVWLSAVAFVLTVVCCLVAAQVTGPWLERKLPDGLNAVVQRFALGRTLLSSESVRS